MKNVIIVLGLLLCSASVFAQSQEDYLKTVDFINKAFNEKQASLIYEKFNTNLKSKIQKGSFQKSLDSLHAEQGLVSGLELLVDEAAEKNYLIEFENNSLLLVLSLTSVGEISKFKIKEY